MLSGVSGWVLIGAGRPVWLGAIAVGTAEPVS
jgi:hypothetical protein